MPELGKECDHFKWVGLLRLGQWIRFLRSHGCTEAIMVGRIKKRELYQSLRFLRYIPDLRTIRVYIREIRKDKRSHAVLLAVNNELAREGITLIDSTQYCPDQLATPGVMTQRHPTPAQQADIDFGWDLCKTVSRLDIGQSIAILNKDVLAVEAIEGTNNMIDRAAQYCKTAGWTLIKCANAQQDMRMDVPTVGVTTIEKLKEAKAGCLVLQVGKTILLEKQKVLELADRYKIAVVGKE